MKDHERVQPDENRDEHTLSDQLARTAGRLSDAEQYRDRAIRERDEERAQVQTLRAALQERRDALARAEMETTTSVAKLGASFGSDKAAYDRGANAAYTHAIRLFDEALAAVKEDN